MRPQDVTSPQDRLSNLRVVYNDGDWSVAQFVWLEDNEQHERVGIRWNGAGDEVGNPQSRGVATWFILPENLIAELVLTYAKWRASDRA